ncbi:hypothetical protein [Commensalibacter papalotli (ex Botero et al. 2024)]|uniref:Uncharacterized protein n=1 Tax=Commensalibacter papalotli (ex Botero et al. 2024) TaxID=2972766 RepID=A0ABM9HKU4_9PROT|nr:hypothetical protein [Commensalibacter papalotli (ex Botero et al. 2024)]CAI3932158.1 unnamed protein product [Commensalibacter papalotli (ex Botero et al. 2024)]CAI3946521.1 unnamed protein product [Commensalibacter papalotli (ex Botero et al. 2024)]
MSDDVLVACKLPHGIYLDVGKQRVKLNGVMQSGRLEAPFFTAPAKSVGLTKVPRDFWEAWIKDHQEFEPIKKGLIFASDKKKRLLDEADEKSEFKSGLERINPSKLPNSLEQVKAGQVG